MGLIRARYLRVAQQSLKMMERAVGKQRLDLADNTSRMAYVHVIGVGDIVVMDSGIEFIGRTRDHIARRVEKLRMSSQCVLGRTVCSQSNTGRASR